MFAGCSKIKKLYLSNFNTNILVNMNHMFFQCRSLKELNISNFNTNKVADMSGMLNDFSSLKEIFSNYDIKNETNIKCMFEGCPKELREKIRKLYKDRYFRDIELLDYIIFSRTYSLLN